MTTPTVHLAPAEFSATLERTDDVTVIVVRGEVDLAVERDFRAALHTAIASGPAVVVDLCPCEFMDARGLTALIGAWKHAEELGIRVTVACTPQEPCDRLFKFALGNRLHVHEDRATAIAFVRPFEPV